MFKLFFFLLLPLISVSSTPCNRHCGTTTVPYPFGFSNSCGIQLSCDSNSNISFSTFPIQNFTANNTILLSMPTSCTRSINSLSSLFGPNYALTWKNGLFLRNCSLSSSTVPPCLLPTVLVSQMSQFHNSCGIKRDNITCMSSKTGEFYLTKENVVQNGCTELFTSVLYERDATGGQTSLIFGKVEVGWWMTGPCQCSANATCTPVPTITDGFQCRCHEGFTGDGFIDGEGCAEEFRIQNSHSISVRAIITIVSVITCASILLSTTTIFLRRRWMKNCYDKDKEDSSTYGTETNLKCILNPNVEYKVFDLIALRNATDDFSDMNKLGKGGFGPVYMGILPNGQEIAVKRLSGSSKQGLRELKNEVDLLAKLKHKNLVQLVGCCIQKHEKLLCYEYLLNGSLDKILFVGIKCLMEELFYRIVAKDHSKHKELNWKMRYKIIEGISRGLHYLHEESRLKIIHRDLKASNILLDINMSPKISDFGLARFFEEDQTHKETSTIAGTFGYMPPEYVLYGNFSAKSDVYSYGILLLEIITGQQNSSFVGSGRSSNLINYAWKNWTNETIHQMKDPMLEDENLEDIKRCVHVALLCVQEESIDRPNMEAVNLMLGGRYSDTIPALPTRASRIDSSVNEEEILQYYFEASQ